MRTGNRGFTLVETAAVVGMVSLLVGVMAPAVKQARLSARGQSSAANLAFIGQGSALYAIDHGGRMPTYTWRPGQHQLSNGQTVFSDSDFSAAARQLEDILMRRTGRLFGDGAIADSTSRFPHMRMLHAVLMDFMGSAFPDETMADPSDALLLQWQNSPLDLSEQNQIPYADEAADYTGYDPRLAWTQLGVKQRWAYGSSYTTTVFAWQRDGDLWPTLTVYRPVASTPHRVSGNPAIGVSEGRNYAEVAFPSAKVHYFEEFDREQPGSPYFAYDHARPAKLMFDGSVNEWASGLAAASADPLNPNPRWRQRYVPLDQFPVPLSGLGEQTLLSQRYRWTHRGLKGLDYPMMAPKGAVER